MFREFIAQLTLNTEIGKSIRTKFSNFIPTGIQVVVLRSTQ